jgi:POT family proton-dependent oligopeptide transporter
MKKSKYRTAPFPTSKLPSGIPFIVGNEAAERFSYYGMRAILVVFMTQYMLDAAGTRDFMSEEEAKSYYHLFSSAVYFFPILGAVIADAFWGKYRTILILSSLYCLGHFFLAIDDTRTGLLLGLCLIALGSGGIKPCVSAHVGDQFGKTNAHLLGKVFSWFYFSINLGAFVSSLLTPWLLATHGPSWAFGVPGFFMFTATLLFWMGRRRFIHVPPGGWAFLKETFSREGIGSIMRLFIIYTFVAVFWSLFDQTGSSWVLQAEKMDRHLFGIEWLSSQVQALNPVLVMFFIPLFSYGIYPLVTKFFRLTPLRKISIGLFLTVPAFLIPAWIEHQIEMGQTPSIAWQLLSYAILTAAEVMVSITCLEFSYTQAPKKMKSFVMAGFMLSVSLGNIFTALVNLLIRNQDGSSKLAGAEYYLFFSGAMLVSALIFIPIAMAYKEKHYIQDEMEAGFIGEVEPEF